MCIYIYDIAHIIYCVQLWLSSLTPFPWGSVFKGQLNILETKELILILV